MTDIDHYLQAATKDNCRRSYQFTVEHFEDVWGDYLPATADNIAQYLLWVNWYLKILMMKQRLPRNKNCSHIISIAVIKACQQLRKLHSKPAIYNF